MFIFNFFSKRPRRKETNIHNINEKLDAIQEQLERLEHLQEKEMAIEKEEVKQLLSIVTRLLQTDVENKGQIQALQTEAADLRTKTEWLNDPELDSQLEGALAAAAGAAPSGPVPTDPGTPVDPAVEEPVAPPVVTGGPAASPNNPVPTTDPAPSIDQPSIADADPSVAVDPVGQDNQPDPNQA